MRLKSDAGSRVSLNTHNSNVVNMAATLSLAVNIGTVFDLFAKVAVLCSHYCADVKNFPLEARQVLTQVDHLGLTLREIERLLANENGAEFDSATKHST